MPVTTAPLRFTARPGTAPSRPRSAAKRIEHRDVAGVPVWVGMWPYEPSRQDRARRLGAKWEPGAPEAIRAGHTGAWVFPARTASKLLEWIKDGFEVDPLCQSWRARFGTPAEPVVHGWGPDEHGFYVVAGDPTVLLVAGVLAQRLSGVEGVVIGCGLWRVPAAHAQILGQAIAELHTAGVQVVRRTSPLGPLRPPPLIVTATPVDGSDWLRLTQPSGRVQRPDGDVLPWSQDAAGAYRPAWAHRGEAPEPMTLWIARADLIGAGHAFELTEIDVHGAMASRDVRDLTALSEIVATTDCAIRPAPNCLASVAKLDRPPEFPAKFKLRLDGLRVKLERPQGVPKGGPAKWDPVLDYAPKAATFSVAIQPGRPDLADAKAIVIELGAQRADVVWTFPASVGAECIVRRLLPALADVEVTKLAADEIEAACGIEAFRGRRQGLDLRRYARALDAEPLVPPLPGPLAALDGYQVAAVRHIVEGRSTLLADAPGAGKSAMTCAALERAEAWPAVVVCPANLRLNWAGEARKWIPHRYAQVITSSRERISPYADLVVVSYELVGKMSAKILAHGPKGLLVDESQFAKERSAGRTKALLALSAGLPADAVRVVMTGTPVINATRELRSQLIIAGLHEIAGTSDKDFVRRWQSRPMDLNDLLLDTAMVRRTKPEILPFLAPLVREHVPIPSTGPDWAGYWNMQAEVRGLRGVDLRKDTKQRMYASGLLGKIRQAAGVAKVADAAAWVEEWRAEAAPGERLIVWAYHHAVVDALVAKIPGSTPYYGGIDLKARQRNLAAWSDPNGEPTVLVGSWPTMGVGLTLHLDGRAYEQLLVELPYTEAELDQLESRLHRRGQVGHVRTWMLVAERTIDAAIVRLLADKKTLMEAVVDGRATDEQEASALEALLARLYGVEDDAEEDDAAEDDEPTEELDGKG